MKTLKKILSIDEKKFTFFVVEDSDIFRELLALFIKDVDNKQTADTKINYQIHSFRSGEDCVKALDKKPDIVVLDYQLDRYPGTEQPLSHRIKLMDGLDTLKAIKQIVPSAEAIMVTAKGDFGVNSKALGAGAAEYLEKGPGLREKLQAAIIRLMNKISIMDEHPLIA